MEKKSKKQKIWEKRRPEGQPGNSATETQKQSTWREGLHRLDRSCYAAYDVPWCLYYTIYYTICYTGFPGGLVVKNPTSRQETWVPSLGWEGPVEKEMTTHSTIRAWKMLWTEEPSGL